MKTHTFRYKRFEFEIPLAPFEEKLAERRKLEKRIKASFDKYSKPLGLARIKEGKAIDWRQFRAYEACYSSKDVIDIYHLLEAVGLLSMLRDQHWDIFVGTSSQVPTSPSGARFYFKRKVDAQSHFLEEHGPRHQGCSLARYAEVVGVSASGR